MKCTIKTKRRALLAALTVLPCAFSQAQEEKEDDVFELSKGKDNEY
jgi:hypothetical protein